MLDLGRTFLQAVEREPSRLAIVDGQKRYSYREWSHHIGAIQQFFYERGLSRGDRILTILQNRYEAATIHWACQMAGIAIVPLNWRSKSEEIDYCAQNADVKLAFVEEISLENYLESETSKAVPVILCSDHSASSRHIYFDQIVRAETDPHANGHTEDISVMLYTSGTTGKPKGVPRKQRAERAAGIAHVAQNQYAMGEVTLGVMPLYHTMGVRTLLSLCIVNGTYVAVPRWEVDKALDFIESEGVTHLYLVPTLYHDMLQSKNFHSNRVRSVRKLGFAGAPMHDALLLKLNESFRPLLFVNHYGSSEIYTYTINQDAVKKPGCAGKAGLNARIRVVKLDQGSQQTKPTELVVSGEEGQIICDLSGDEAFEGYWKRPDADQKTIREGWYFTGDTGYYDVDGDLFVTGRVDDMIISGGENISPVEIESILSLHPSVGEVAVAGLKDERLGQKVVAFIRASGSVDSDALDQYCRGSDLINFKRPREYVFVKEIPKSPVGKVLRRMLVAGEYERA
ncbi:AMP-binding protein [Polynucleobacter sp. AP-Sanab-80-C2]|uniref:AMP-binding protein n=1 Tax=Polynucleobacter sp. AP-Sanab-80-C2 TaxID=3108274 RepID=UPI002B22F368|nr:AMP-binding protein [Polynucleobacter sp. AP-Sanab-80-C2]MEA9599747.1 AMP-binding protein [Polynucleobacter sp. AP-Sanab-80-C2]